MKLIDADDCKDLMYVMCAGQDKAFVRAMEQVVDDCPDVDAAPVVRCKECKRWQRHTEVDRERGPCRINGMITHQDDFCSYGERRESK